jgi:hypothetical protein
LNPSVSATWDEHGQVVSFDDRAGDRNTFAPHPIRPVVKAVYPDEKIFAQQSSSELSGMGYSAKLDCLAELGG